MNSSIVNLCKDGGSGMSECTSAGMGHEKQCVCSFYKPSTAGNRCRFETMEEFCDRVAAQKHAKGQPILMSDLSNYVYHVVDNSGTLEPELIKEVTKTIEKMKDEKITEFDLSGQVREQMRRDRMLTFGIPRRLLFKDENGDFHAKNLKPTEDPLDYHFPYIDGDGNIRYATRKAFEEENELDPCLGCALLNYSDDCNCRSRERYLDEERYELDEEQTSLLSFHEMAHKVGKDLTRGSWIHNEWRPIDDPENDHYAEVTIQDRRVADEMHGFNRRSSWYDERIESFETIQYVMSREISKATIMERHSENLLAVVSPNQVLTDCESEHEKLLLDKEYLILYTPLGEVALLETMNFLRQKASMWRKLVPSDALPTRGDQYFNGIIRYMGK